MQVKAQRICQKGVTFYLVKFRLGDLVDGETKFKVDRIDVSEETGYQRPLDPKRVNSVKNYILEEEGLFPNSVQFNVRERMQFNEEENGWGTLHINGDLWLVDGQHRIEGLLAARNQDRTVLDFEIPAVILDGFSWHEEIKRFYKDNSTQVGVPIDVATRHLIKQERAQGIESIIGREEEVMALQVTDRLALHPDSPWYGRVQLSDQPKKGPGQVIAQKSLYRSLLPVMRLGELRGRYVSAKDDNAKDDVLEDISYLLKNYWHAIKEICPEAFQEPGRYLLQKTTGAYVMHLLFLPIFNRMSNDFSKDAFLELLQYTGMSSADWTRETAGQYQGMQGFKKYSLKFEQKLPPLPRIRPQR